MLLEFIIYYKKIIHHKSYNNQIQIIKIIDIKDNYYIAKIKDEKVIFYTNNDYKINDKIKGYIKEFEIDSLNIEFTFDYEDYLKKQGIIKKIKLENEILVKQNYTIKNLKYKIKNYLLNHYPDKTKKYLVTIFLGINILDDNIYEIYKNFNLTHLFSISGVHINFIVLFLNFILKKLKIKNIIIEFILIFYLYFLNFIPSVFRSVSCYIFKKRFNMSSFNALNLSLIIILLIFPNVFFLPQFYLSYLSSFLIIMLDLKKDKFSNLKLLINLNIFLFPFLINLNNKFSIIALFISYIYSILFIKFVLPFSFMTLFIPFFKTYYENIIILFEKIISNINCNYIIFKNYSNYKIIIYYIVYYLYKVTKHKFYLLSLILLVIINNFGVINLKNEVIFLNVGQGDSSVYINKYNKCNIVIDSFNNTYEYLIKRGIKKIDYLIFSHGDLDHILNYEKIIDNIKVKNILISKYDYSDDIIKIEEKNNNVIRVKSDDYFNCGDALIKILSPIKKYDSLNDNSIVLKLFIKDKTFLYTGDISKSVEKDLVNRYKYDLKSDYLKVSHHGSNTSTDKIFVKYVNPKISFISCGKNNIYNFPKQEVLDTLKNSDIHISYKRKSLKVLI